MRHFIRTTAVAAVLAAAFLGAASVQRGQAASSTPQHVEGGFTVPAGGIVAVQAIPQANTPTHVSTTIISGAPRGSCALIMSQITAAPAGISWVGTVPSSATGGVAQGGYATALGATICPISANGDVLLRVGTTLSKLEVVNNTAGAVTVAVEMLW